MILLIRFFFLVCPESLRVFKFQYDSINTPLSSTMICTLSDFKFQYDSINTLTSPVRLHLVCSLNSNMILLIRASKKMICMPFMYFKFQYDSINTLCTLFLSCRPLAFKFQYDSINTPS